MIVIKSQKELDRMRTAGRVVATTLQEIQERIRPGITTAEIDKLAARTLAKLGAESPFLGYPNVHDRRRPFPGVV
ncbi:MAG: M24 family metallopeptidase, partial [Anaerolineales bacterium]